MSSEWSKVSLGKVANIFTGFSFKGNEYLMNGVGIRVVRGDNVTEHSLRWGEKEKRWPSITEILKPYKLRVGDIVIGMDGRSEEHTSELQSLLCISYAVFCLKKNFFNDTATTEIYTGEDTLSLHDALRSLASR